MEKLESTLASQKIKEVIFGSLEVLNINVDDSLVQKINNDVFDEMKLKKMLSEILKNVKDRDNNEVQDIVERNL